MSSLYMYMYEATVGCQIAEPVPFFDYTFFLSPPPPPPMQRLFIDFDKILLESDASEMFLSIKDGKVEGTGGTDPEQLGKMVSGVEGFPSWTDIIAKMSKLPPSFCR